MKKWQAQLAGALALGFAILGIQAPTHTTHAAGYVEVPMSGVATVAYVPNYRIAVYQQPGGAVLPQKLPHASRWKVLQATWANGQMWYNLGRNQWLPSKYAVLNNANVATNRSVDASVNRNVVRVTKWATT